MKAHLQWRQFNFFEKEQIYDPIERSRSPKWLQVFIYIPFFFFFFS